MRRRAGRERGAEAMEFVACLGLLVAVLAMAIRAAGIVRLQLEAEADARLLARQAVVCEGAAPASLARIDPAAPAGSHADIRRIGPALVRATVTLAGSPIVPALASTTLTPAASVVMRLEPGCR